MVLRWIYSFMTSQAKSGLALSSSLLLSSQKSTICTLSSPPASLFISIVLLSMSFEKEYIEKYGQNAIEAYKRSLEHSDLPSSPGKHLPKSKIKRSSSSKNVAQSKPHSNGVSQKNPLQQKTRQGGQLNSVQLFIHPTKKKLVISDLSTPKETPNKTLNSRRGQKNLTTNVNVFVNAMNRSKSKESTPCRDKQRKKKCKPSFSSSFLLEEVSSLLAGSLPQPDPRKVQRALDLLRMLQRQERKEREKRVKQEQLVDKIRGMVAKVSPSKEAQLNETPSDYVRQLQAEVQNYMEKEQSLLKIIQSLSSKNGRADRSGPGSSEEEDEDDL